jgi:multiple sugar transport system permease protein
MAAHGGTVPRPVPGGYRRQKAIRQAFRATIAYALLIVGSIAMIVPFLWMVSTSLKTPAEIFQFPPTWIPNRLVWQNYIDVWTMAPFGRYLFNSTFVTVTVMILEVLTASMAAFAFARLRFPGREAMFYLYLGTLMIPGQVTIIPNFVLMRYLGWIDTYFALIIPAAFTAFGTFLLRQFFLTIPFELEQAARIDGCGFFGIYARIILPLAGPAIATLAIFSFLAQWNSFLWPLIVTNSEYMRTLTVALRFFQDEYVTDYHLLMAGAVCALVPVMTVFVIGQKYFVRGIALTGMGGR